MNADDIDFSYDGNDEEEVRRLASEPKKQKPVKVAPVKKKEQRPIVIPNKAIDIAIQPTPVVLEENATSTTQKEPITLEKTIVQTNKEIDKSADINTPALIATTVVAAASVAVLSNVIKAKTKIKNKTNKTDSKKSDNRSKEEKKEEEQKQCNSRSDKVQSLLDETNKMISESAINKVQIKEDKAIKNKIKALNLELALVNKTIKKIEENTHKKKTK